MGSLACPSYFHCIVVDMLIAKYILNFKHILFQNSNSTSCEVGLLNKETTTNKLLTCFDIHNSVYVIEWSEIILVYGFVTTQFSSDFLLTKSFLLDALTTSF